MSRKLSRILMYAAMAVALVITGLPYLASALNLLLSAVVTKCAGANCM